LEEKDKVIYQASTQVDVPGAFGERFGLSSIVPIVPPSSQSQSSGSIAIRPTSTLNRGEDAFLYFRVFPGKEERSQNATVSYSIYRGDQQLRTLDQPDPLSLSESKEGGEPVIARLPTSELAPGRYRILVRITDPKLDRRATGEIELAIQ
jgi:hypothetical protein